MALHFAELGLTESKFPEWGNGLYTHIPGLCKELCSWLELDCLQMLPQIRNLACQMCVQVHISDINR